MKKQLYILFLLLSTLGYSQTYNWQWAKYGGGTMDLLVLDLHII